jgi:exosortase
MRMLIFLALLVGLAGTLYREALLALAVAVLHRHGSSHGLFVPFISGYLIWLWLEDLKRLRPAFGLLPGGAMILVGLLVLYFSRSTAGLALPALSFLLVAAGLVLTLFGGALFKAVRFPLIFLAAMIPLPEPVYAQMAEWMRQATTWGTVALLDLIDLPLHREGYDIYLPGMHLYVAHACSGIRYLLSYSVFGLAYGFRYKRSTKSRILVVAATLPLSVLAGVLRLSVTFAAAYYIHPSMANHRPHVILSWTVFAVLLLLAIGADRWFSGVRNRGSGIRGSRQRAASSR